MTDRIIESNGQTYINGQPVKNPNSYPSAEEDPFWFLNPDNQSVSPTIDEPQEKVQPDTDHSADDIDPSLVRNNTPFQSIERIAGLLERVGIPTAWEQHFACPCINPDTNQPKPNCPICGGRGIAFRKARYLQVAFQKNARGAYNGSYGNNELGTTIATPQITENGIENGISFRDRLSVPGLTLSQDYIFNVTDRRVANGVLIPYKVISIDHAVTMNDKFELEELHEGADFTFDSLKGIIIPAKRLIGQQISLNITAELRYYVVDISKETRWAQTNKQADKEISMKYQDTIFDKYMHQYNKLLSQDIVTFRLPKLLVLRREDLYYPPHDFEDETGQPLVDNTLDPKDNLGETNIQDLLGRD